MNTDQLLASLEEYFSIKQDLLGEEDLEALRAAKKRVDLCLKEYFRDNFDKAFLEERRRTSSETRKMSVVDPAGVVNKNIAWDDVVKILDFVNSCPIPVKDLRDPLKTDKWMKNYNEWYQKRMSVLNKIIPPLQLDLENEI